MPMLNVVLHAVASISPMSFDQMQLACLATYHKDKPHLIAAPISSKFFDKMLSSTFIILSST
jgi:hypothetical protein